MLYKFYLHVIKFLKMEKRAMLVTFSLVVMIYFLSSVQGAELDDAQKKECLILSKRTLKVMMKSFNACNKELGYHKISGEEYQKKIGCVVKCVMKSVAVLDENDLMTPATLKKSIEDRVPEHFQQIAHDKLGSCVNMHKLDPKDENCQSYLDMGTCMQSTMVDMCGEAPMM